MGSTVLNPGVFPEPPFKPVRYQIVTSKAQFRDLGTAFVDTVQSAQGLACMGDESLVEQRLGKAYMDSIGVNIGDVLSCSQIVQTLFEVDIFFYPANMVCPIEKEIGYFNNLTALRYREQCFDIVVFIGIRLLACKMFTCRLQGAREQ